MKAVIFFSLAIAAAVAALYCFTPPPSPSSQDRWEIGNFLNELAPWQAQRLNKWLTTKMCVYIPIPMMVGMGPAKARASQQCIDPSPPPSPQEQDKMIGFVSGLTNNQLEQFAKHFDQMCLL